MFMINSGKKKSDPDGCAFSKPFKGNVKAAVAADYTAVPPPSANGASAAAGGTADASDASEVGDPYPGPAGKF